MKPSDKLMEMVARKEITFSDAGIAMVIAELHDVDDSVVASKIVEAQKAVKKEFYRL